MTLTDIAIILGAWLFFMAYGCLLCLIVRDFHKQNQPIKPKTWQEEVKEIMYCIPFGDELSQLVTVSSTPVDFIDNLDKEIESMAAEINGRSSPFGVGFCASFRHGGSIGRPYKGLDRHELDMKACTYQKVYDYWMRVK